MDGSNPRPCLLLPCYRYSTATWRYDDETDRQTLDCSASGVPGGPPNKTGEREDKPHGDVDSFQQIDTNPVRECTSAIRLDVVLGRIIGTGNMAQSRHGLPNDRLGPDVTGCQSIRVLLPAADQRRTAGRQHTVLCCHLDARCGWERIV